MRSESDASYIYALKCPIEGKVRYIGKSNNPNMRQYRHISSPVNSKMAAWISDLTRQGTRPILIVLARVRKAENGRFVEQQFILRYHRLGHPLLNLDIQRLLLNAEHPRTFGAKLRRIREDRRMSQRELGELLEIDLAYLSRIENDAPNHTPGPTTIERMSKALKLGRSEADELFALAGKVPPDVLSKMLAKPALFERIRKA